MKSDGSKYKMIVTDMDYTLLNKSKQVSERNKQALKKAMEKGTIVVVATGRLYTSAKFYAKLLGIKTPIIASNGAVIREEATGRTIYQSLLPEEAGRAMIKLCKDRGLYCHLYTSDTIYAEKLINISQRYSEWNASMKEEDRINIEIVDDLYDIIDRERGSVLKAVVVSEDSKKLDEIREEIMKTGIVTASQSLKDNLEVMNSDVSKGNAIKILSEIYGVDRGQIIAIGDNENDISMIEYAGLGIAMGNSEQCLKEKADYITEHYENDGVAHAIEKFILQ